VGKTEIGIPPNFNILMHGDGKIDHRRIVKELESFDKFSQSEDLEYLHRSKPHGYRLESKYQFAQHYP